MVPSMRCDKRAPFTDDHTRTHMHHSDNESRCGKQRIEARVAKMNVVEDDRVKEKKRESAWHSTLDAYKRPVS